MGDHNSRSGKTFAIVYALIVRACKVKSRHAMLRNTFNSIKTSVYMDTLPKVLNICFPDLPVKWNKTDYFIQLPNGSEIFFCGLDDDKRVEKILGKEFSTLALNECSQLSYRNIQIALTRLAEKNSLKKKVYYDENPPSRSHWSYYLFIKKLDPSKDEPLSNPENYASILMNPKDNMENIDEEYLLMLESLPPKERDRFLEGKFVNTDDGLAYYTFDPDLYVKPCETFLGTKYYACDWNVDPMAGVILQIANNKIYVQDEVFLRNSDTYKLCDHMNKRGYSGLSVIPDSTGRNRKTSGKSDFDIMKENGFSILSVFNPMVIDRVNNINRLFSQNRIIIDPKCKKLINDLNKVSWKDGNLDQKTDKLLTHISDALGYGAWKLFPINGTKQRATSIPR